MTRPVEELEKGKWPSYVTEWKKAGYTGLVEIYNKALEDKKTHFKHGGMVGYPGYDAGVIGRLSDMPEILGSSHVFRMLEPAGWFYKTESLRKVVDVWTKYGNGLINFHGATGSLQLVGIETENIEPAFEELAKLHYDFGGSGGDVRTLAACGGPAICEYSNIDTLDLYQALTMRFIEDIHRPRFPYKWKIKIPGCPNDCVAATARSDFAIIGNFRDAIKIDQNILKEYPEEKILKVVNKCPTSCMSYENEKLDIDMGNCTRCMYCINEFSKALRPGDDKGATILIGARARGRIGAFLGWTLIPFIKVEAPYTRLIEIIVGIQDWWDEIGNPKERVGEAIYRIGFGKFLFEVGKELGIDPVPQMITRPRANPFWFYWPGEVE